MRLTIIGLLVAATMAATGSTVSANDLNLNCELNTAFVSRSLFNNTGTFATMPGGANLSYLDCTHTPTGIYANIWGSLPFKDFNVGNEVDTRLGWRGSVSGFDIDASVAEYNFGVGRLGRFNTFDARFGVASTIGLGGGFSIRPYVTADYQHSITLHGNDLGIGGGEVISAKLSPKLTASVDGAAWYHPVAEYNPGKGPVWSVAPKVSYAITDKLSVGPLAMFTWGDVTRPGNYQIKSMVGGFVSLKF